MLKMAIRKDTIVDVTNRISIREDVGNKRDQNPNNTTLKNRSYYIHHD